jgi:hypothetical protein
LADICLVIGVFRSADRYFCEGGVKGCQFRSGYSDPDGRGVVDYLGDRVDPGKCAGNTGADAEQLVVPGPVCGGDGAVVVILLPRVAVGEGVGGECNRQGKYTIYDLVVLSLFAGAIDRPGDHRGATDHGWDDGIDLEVGEYCLFLDCAL